jgi:hypothetical protein
MNRLDEIRAEIVGRLESAQLRVAMTETQLQKGSAEAREIDAELRAHDRAVEAMQEAQAEPEPGPSKRQRHDVRGAVRARLEQVGEGVAIDEGVIATALEQQGISAAALHSYLLRAVKTGEVERDGKSNRYRLPGSQSAEFTLAALPQDAAE